MINISLFIQDFEQRMHAAPMSPIHRSELICISYLVFYSGIRKDEIGSLQVRDVIDEGGQARSVVKKYKNEIQLVNEAGMAIEKYYYEMKEQRPWQAYRRKPFFPSYQNSGTLSRHWKKANTGYNEIRKAGMKNHFTSSRTESSSLGALYKEGSEQFRITTREYQAVTSNKKIPDGNAVNDQRCIEYLLELLDKAEKIPPKEATAQSDAKNILKEAHETLSKIKNDGIRQSHFAVIHFLEETLSTKLK